MSENWTERVRKARRVVIKLGTNTVTAGQDISLERLVPIARSIADAQSEGRQIVLVSSGAVGLGAAHLGLARARLNDVATKQACAAVGQSRLMHAYEQLFFGHGVRIAQLLLTEADFTEWARYQNLRRTMERLLKLGVVPIVNENDTVSTAELEAVADNGQRVFSDNDRLAALVMSHLDAEALILLTNVDGLRAVANDAKTLIPLVEEITPALRAVAAGPDTGGRGGMVTKLDAAQIATSAGGIAVIANGARPDTLRRIFAGEPVGTVFVSKVRMAGKRRWIAFATNIRGCLTVNAGAQAALLGGKASLLSSGVVHITDNFAAQDVVSIVDATGREIARGIANCNSDEARQMLQDNDKTRQRAKDHVIVTRDNIVLRETQE